MTFLCNHRHAIAAMDFFVVPTITFRLIYGFFVIHHDRRRVLHASVTEHPSAAWVIQQLREAFPWEVGIEYLIFDRDSTFSAEVRGAIESMGIKIKRTAFRSPWQNSVAERWVGCLRQSLLHHVIVLNERHLKGLMSSYLDYHHPWRTHQSLDRDAPDGRPVRAAEPYNVVEFPAVTGLHHVYLPTRCLFV